MRTTDTANLFGTKTRTNILYALALMEESHAAELVRILDINLSTIQNALDKLEQAGVVAGVMEGRSRRVRLNPRYYAREELRALLEKLAPHNKELVKRISDLRRRPRRAGKAL